MTPTTMPDARQIIDLALKLPPTDREQIAHELWESVHPPEDPEEVKQAWREEIARRIESVRSGTVKTHSVEETMEYLQKVVDEGRRT